MNDGKVPNTNALRMLDAAGVKYKLHFFLQEAALEGTLVADIMKWPYHRVFKTLVAQGRTLLTYVFVIPVDQELDMKLAAMVVGEKAVSMLPSNQLTAATGYMRGACSPIGMRKKYATIIDGTAAQRRTICVSAGHMGLQVELEPESLRMMTGARYEFVTRDAARYMEKHLGIIS